jgi:hypothetical protein
VTDESDQAYTEPGAPAPIPLPMATAEAPKTKRKVWPWVVGVLVLITLVGGCVGAVWLLDSAGKGIDDAIRNSGIWGEEAVSWSGNGRFGVTQYYLDYTYPSVAIWDRKTGETRDIDGYRVLFVEPYAPVIWLEPVTNKQAEMADFDDSLGDYFDHKPARLVAWRLDDGSEPTDDVPAKWGAWPGPGETIAYLEINPLKGAGPSALLFNNNDSHGEGVKAELPETVRTFIPVGWSASGRYFAIEQLYTSVSFDSEGDAQDSPRSMLVFDVTTGEVAGDFAMNDGSVYAPAAAWDGAQDRLFWMETSYPAMDGPAQIRMWTAQATDTTAADAFKAMGWEKPAEFDDSYDAGVLGWDPSGPLFTVDGRIWQASANGFVNLGMTNSMNGAWYPGSGLLGIEYGYGSGPVDEEWTELVLYDKHGGSRKSVWRGPTSNAPID